MTNQPNIGVKFDIEKDDLVAIAVSREEVKLKQQKEALEHQLRQCRKEAKEKQHELTKVLDTHYEQVVSRRVKDLVAAFKAFDIHYEVVYHTSPQGYLQNRDVQHYEGSIQFVDPDTRRDKGSFRYDVNTVPSLEALREDIWALQAREEDLTNEIIDARKRLGELDTLERQARAAVAMKILGDSAEGQAMLESIQGVKSLTAPKADTK